MINYRNKFLVVLLLAIVLFGSFCFLKTAEAALTDQVKTQLTAGSGERGTTEVPPDPRYIMEGIIQVALMMVGTIFTAMIFYGGYQYLTAGGEEERAKKGMTLIQEAVIGLVVILLSYAITLFVGNRISRATVDKSFEAGGDSAGGYELELPSRDIRDIFR